MTVRSRSHFILEEDAKRWVDNKGHTYGYGTLTQAGYDAKQEGSVGKQYVVRLGANLTKLDAPNPPFTQGEGGHWDRE
ncbi:MAG: hypothetical protein ABI851_16065 [Saprospiraceae bacterium]